MTTPPPSARSTGGKSRFEDIYDQPDPRPYFTRLKPLQYEIPHHAQDVFRRTAAARTALPDNGTGPPWVLDACCSYGINAALLNHDLTLADLYDHYTGPQAQRLTTDELILWDKEFYAAHRRPDAFPVLGLDIATRAVRYAQSVGLLDAALTDNLEHHPPGPDFPQSMENVGLITLTGGGSYITHRTFDALLRAARRPVWVSAFFLRTVSYTPLTATLAAHGLHTATDPHRTWPQRRFTGPREQQHAIEAARTLGTDPTGREQAGWFHTVLHESRPPGHRLP
ncbi:hypothetical protein [Streptomyces sp. CA-146814]|uniref:hypothetical protein n=1 Tax=Streptomyces sp. CA-146814 TaxID=3240053 RepID=UPI003D8D5B65